MNDLIKRLQAKCAPSEWDIALQTEPEFDPLLKEAADEIERQNAIIVDRNKEILRLREALMDARGLGQGRGSEKLLSPELIEIDDE